jgi:hypothetical protein
MEYTAAGDPNEYMPLSGRFFDEQKDYSLTDYTEVSSDDTDCDALSAAGGYADTGIVTQEISDNTVCIDKARTEQPLPDTELRLAAIELAQKEYSRVRSELVNMVDWRTVFNFVVKNHVEERSYERLADLLEKLRMQTADEHQLDLEKTVSGLGKMKEWQQAFETAGHMLPTDCYINIPEGWQPNTRLGDEMMEWRKGLINAETQISNNRSRALYKPLVRGMTTPAAIYRLHQSMGAQEYDPQQEDVPLPIVYALERCSADIQQALYDADQEYRDRPADAPMEVRTGAYEDALRKILGVDSVAAFIDGVLERHPAAFTSHITAIEFVDDLPPVDYPDGTQSTSAADMSSRAHVMRFNMSSEAIGGMAATDRADNSSRKRRFQEIRQAANRTVITSYMDHEVFHHGHQERIPIQWLIDWETIDNNGQVDVTNYVAKSRTRSEAAGKKENTADSGALYMNKPRTLRALSPDRFNIINELYKRYTKNMLRISDIVVASEPMSAHIREDAVLAKTADNHVKFGLFQGRHDNLNHHIA